MELDLLGDLEVFLSERHVTRAAGRLGITQSAASQRLARLREQLDDPLLVPGRRGLVLTPRAQAIAGPLSAALSALRGAVRAGETFVPAESRRCFVLLGNDLFEAWGMPEVVELCEELAPDVTLSAERAGADFAERLERGTADLAFVPNFVIPEALRRVALPDEPFVVLVRRGHPAARRRLTLARYLELDHLLIAPRGLPGSLVDSALERLGKTRRVSARIQHFSSAPFVVAGSDLALTCPASVAAMARPFFALSALTPPVELAVDRTSMVWHERAQRDPSHSWFRTQVMRKFQSSPRSRRR